MKFTLFLVLVFLKIYHFLGRSGESMMLLSMFLKLRFSLSFWWNRLFSPHGRTGAIEQGLFGNWIIVHARDPQFAWSGAMWVRHAGGVGTRRAHVCSFYTMVEAESYAEENGLKLVQHGQS
jgi:hypothetical protein